MTCADLVDDFEGLLGGGDDALEALAHVQDALVVLPDHLGGGKGREGGQTRLTMVLTLMLQCTRQSADWVG